MYKSPFKMAMAYQTWNKASFEELAESEFKFIAFLGKQQLKGKTTFKEAVDEAECTNELLKCARTTYRMTEVHGGN